MFVIVRLLIHNQQPKQESTKEFVARAGYAAFEFCQLMLWDLFLMFGIHPPKRHPDHS